MTLFRLQDEATFRYLMDCPECAVSYVSGEPRDLDAMEPCREHAWLVAANLIACGEMPEPHFGDDDDGRGNDGLEYCAGHNNDCPCSYHARERRSDGDDA